MSKTTVGDVYSKVIEEVCAHSRVDFEESGVEHGTLDLLKSVWQKKLSQLNVAQLPWDPKPEPTQPAGQSTSKPPVPAPSPAPVPSNGHLNTSVPAQAPVQSQPTPTPAVKQEPQAYPAQQSADPVAYPPPQFPQGGPMNAQQRAAMHLHQRYGNQAGPQIAQLQQQHVQNRNPMQQQSPTNLVKKEENGSDLSNTPEFKIETNQAVPLKTLQTDGGADEYETEIAQRRAAIAQYKTEGDRLMRSHFMASQQQLEAGGLLLPLESRQLPTTRPSKPVPDGSGSTDLLRAQGDAAGGDDDEEDEDAINSDLDDPDELENADEQEENVHEVMLCTYDKVQRVKNKWKCTLKDGILRVDQQEYVFHKGQGEFEW